MQQLLKAVLRTAKEGRGGAAISPTYPLITLIQYHPLNSGVVRFRLQYHPLNSGVVRFRFFAFWVLILERKVRL
jgi:hypothetical protein